jgi:hypothetical protein|mmetsp:Transcript_53359/g.84841  ORF Transcript_53359/g.84841 Transcript_53359/m.84841 type:complete len:166 (-) Transcript_53359:45-542(-)
MVPKPTPSERATVVSSNVDLHSIDLARALTIGADDMCEDNTNGESDQSTCIESAPSISEPYIDELDDCFWDCASASLVNGEDSTVTFAFRNPQSSSTRKPINTLRRQSSSLWAPVSGLSRDQSMAYQQAIESMDVRSLEIMRRDDFSTLPLALSTMSQSLENRGR